MGGVFSKKQAKSDDYEKILSELDDEIQTAEIRLSEIKLRERRTGLLWILYSSVIWVAFLLYSFIVLHRPDKDIYTWDTLAVTVVPVLLIPVGIYYARRLLKLFYTRKQTNEESNLAALRAQQKLKLEELKKKTSYYTTKSLLERYDLAATNAERRKQQQQQQQQQPTRPASMPSPRSPQNQDLRHRSTATAQAPRPMQQQQHPNNQQPVFQARPTVAPMGAPSKERLWYDKLVDALVGEEGPETKYALICQHCFAHNGLVLPQEIGHIQYTCPHCKQFNPARAPHSSGATLASPGPASSPAPAPAPSPSTGDTAEDQTKEGSMSPAGTDEKQKAKDGSDEEGSS